MADKNRLYLYMYINIHLHFVSVNTITDSVWQAIVYSCSMLQDTQVDVTLFAFCGT